MFKVIAFAFAALTTALLCCTPVARAQVAVGVNIGVAGGIEIAGRRRGRGAAVGGRCSACAKESRKRKNQAKSGH